MPATLTEIEWIEILQNQELTFKLDIDIFQTLYSFEGHQAAASQVGLILGNKGKNPASPLNLEIGRYAKRIAKIYDIDFTVRSNQKFKFWDLFFNGWDKRNLFIWQLKPELVNALKQTELTGEEKLPEEILSDNSEIFQEGLKKTIFVNSYERNSKARSSCINYWKPICSVCEFDFEKTYGKLGEGFIHVHHLKPVSEIGELYQIDPIEDLRPVCPNCHSMLHRKNPPLSIDELKDIITK